MRFPLIGVFIALSLCVTGIGGQQPACAQTSPQQMERPTWKPGDRWVHTARNPRRGSGREFSIVSKIGEFEGKPAYFIRIDIEWMDSQGRKSHDRYTRIRDMDFTVIGTLDDRDMVIERWNVAWLKWPLIVGDQWNVDGPYELLMKNGWQKRRLTGSVFVKGVEEITASGRTFNAFHVQGVYRTLDERGQTIDHLVEDIWFSPEARIWVKYSYTGAFAEEEELAESHPAP